VKNINRYGKEKMSILAETLLKGAHEFGHIAGSRRIVALQKDYDSNGFEYLHKLTHLRRGGKYAK